MKNDESDGRYSVNSDTISACRLDKLLSDILLPANACLEEEVALAHNLQRQWRLRFRQEYFDMDKKRFAKLATRYGQLRDLTFTKTQFFAYGRWDTKRCESLSEVEGNQQFEPGHWWLNLACAARDGVVGATHETPTKGRYGFAALPLMSGNEVVDSDKDLIKYTRDSTLTDASVSLITQVGAKTRLLRGHCLKSPFAPKSGVRYDGLYVIRQYGHKLQADTGLHRVVITLERVPGQRPMDELLQIPRPSQMDDWIIFEKYEGEMVKKRQGNEAFTEWKVEKAQEKVDHSQWERVARMAADLMQRKEAMVQFAKEHEEIP
ncbi:sra-ydg [Akanthomyces lecanii RCEF 1005]|uniref:Sra-ydg n=1 Tax=Akanthomyces lecanii RCEF 1005 TaxID=1081108 RepID=A0A162K6P4_CORDF|nr:sra-ydg [Akanthomyces lecanii RCEF 1005]